MKGTNLHNRKYNKIIKEISFNRKSNNFIQHYLKIIEPVYLNDTNKNIIRFYLNFIRKNDENVKRFNLISFDEEIEKYKLIFTVREMNEIKKGIKNNSEKNNFIELLKKLSNIVKNNNDNNNNDNNKKYIMDIYKQIENDFRQIKYFNYPIEFSNQELFYYKLYSLLIKQINEIYNNSEYSESDKIDYMKNKKAIAKLILNEKILDNEKIIKNENKMNLLMLFILYDKLDDKKESINFNRLLKTEKINCDELKNYVIKNNIGEINKYVGKNEYILKLKNDEIIEILESNDICEKNLDKENMDYIYDKYKYNNLDSLLEKNGVTPYLERIQKFLDKIINSKVYKEAIRKLFPEYKDDLLNLSTKDIKKCIESRFKFYPYQDLNNCGFTDKFSCYSYISVLFNIFSRQKKYYNCLRCGAIVDISLHELNHINQNILYFLENNEDLFNSPKREGLEEILFGRKIERLRILECFYLLNENNYDQSLNDFRNNFKKLYDNSIEYSIKKDYIQNNNNNAIFKKFFLIIKNFGKEEFKEIELFGIQIKGQNSDFQDASIFLPKKFCKMG